MSSPFAGPARANSHRPRPGRRRRLPTRPVSALAATITVALTLGACTSGGHGPSTGPSPVPSTGTANPTTAPAGSGRVAERIGSAVELRLDAGTAAAANPASLATAEQAFGLDLLARTGASAPPTRNVTVSPASLAEILAMLEQGARGRTATQIATALRTGSLSRARQSAAWRALTAAWATGARHDRIDLDIANSLWQQRGTQVRPDYLRSLATYYDSGVWQTDFRRDPSGSLDALNTWTSRNTAGKITKLFDRLPSDTRLVLADAIYLKAAWATPFDAGETSPGPFTRGDGKVVTAEFMRNRHAPARYAITSTYQAVELPYRGGHFSALAIMPTDADLATFSRALDATHLRAIVSSLRGGTVDLSMPKFTTRTTSDLADTLKAMGMSDAFGQDADFTGITANLEVSEIVQRTYLRVAEKGTVAAAATGAAMVPTAIQAGGTSITLDHPFLFLIRDNRTGALLFASQIQNPGA